MRKEAMSRNRTYAKPRVLISFIATGTLSIAGCQGLGGLGGGVGEPKNVQVRFRTFDVGTDDCEDIFSFGDFTVQMRIVVQPSGEEVFNTSRFAELGSATLQASVQSIDLDESVRFELLPGEEFEVQVTITEDDSIDSFEPQPWSETDSFDHLTVDTETVVLTNGPGCFSDDRFEYDIDVLAP